MIDLPTVPTVTHVDRYGEAAVLEALRERFRREHEQYPQYAGWEQDTVLAKITLRQGGFKTYVSAELDDVVLAKPSHRDLDPLYFGDLCWVPRVGHVCEFSNGVKTLDDRFLFQLLRR